MKLSERLISLRKQKGISQEELANELGISRQSVSKWESEQTTPDLDKIVFLSEFYSVSTDYILTGKEETVSNELKHDETSLYVSILLNVGGLILIIGLWRTYQESVYTALGLIAQLGGMLLFLKVMKESSKPILKWLKVLMVVVFLAVPIYLVVIKLFHLIY